MISHFFWDPNPVAFRIPIVNHPVAWYGILFVPGFIIGYYVFLMLSKGLFVDFPSPKKEAAHFADKLLLYIMFSAVVGARLAHILFYEDVFYYLAHPWLIFKVWEGGLASHGGAVAVVLGISLFYTRYLRKDKRLSFFSLLDLLVIPFFFPCILIRIGNFINQEILGTKTTVPWAVVFGHPIDGSIPTPRHPVQLYEAGFYLIACVVFAFLVRRLSRIPGMLVGLFFSVIFSFRFFVEFLKEEQSIWMTSQGLTMGQFLSIPLILFGVALTLYSLRARRILSRNQRESSF